MAILNVTGRRNNRNLQVVGQVIVDDDLLPTLQQYVWTGSKAGYVTRRVRQANGRNKVQTLHYFVWEHHHGANSVPRGLFVDHLNQDKSDNRIGNLVLANGRVKQANAPKHSDNTTGYKEVSQDRRSRKFVAKIGRDYRQKYVGTYGTAEEAAQAVNVGYGILHPEVPTPNALPPNALSPQQMAAVAANVRRLLQRGHTPRLVTTPASSPQQSS